MTTTQALPVAKYLGITDGRHHFALEQDHAVPHRLKAGDIVTDSIVRELKGNLPLALDTLTKDCLIYPS